MSCSTDALLDADAPASTKVWLKRRGACSVPLNTRLIAVRGNMQKRGGSQSVSILSLVNWGPRRAGSRSVSRIKIITIVVG